MAAEPRLPVREVRHIAIVVNDMQKTIERYWSVFGIGPWKIFDWGPQSLPMTYQGRPANFKLRFAVATVGQLNLEVIQPIEGKSVWGEFLAKHGPGIHHIGIVVEKPKEAAAKLEAEGYQALISGFGSDGVSGFAYMDATEDLATVIELFRPREPAVEAEETYP